MSDEIETRDELLGAALRGLDVPSPRDDFDARLLARLEAEAQTRGRQRWRWAAGSPLWVGAAAAMLVVVLAVSWVGLPGRNRSGVLGPDTAAAVTADEVRARVDAAVAGLQTLRGELHIDPSPGTVDPPPGVGGRPPLEHFTFAITSTGDFRVEGLHDGSVTAYSTAQGTQRSFSTAAGGSTLAAELTGLAPGPPDPSPRATELSRSLGSVVRNFLRTDADVPVEDVVHDGRPAWHLVVPLSYGEGAAGELDVTVDQQSGFPLRVVDVLIATPLLTERIVRRELRISNLVVDEPVPPDTFLPSFPPGTPPVRPVDRGYRRVQQREVAAAVGYAPLLPRDVPAGFRLVEVAVAPAGAPTADGNPPSRNVVSMAWQRGFDRFVVTTRDAGADRSRWSDPFAALGVRSGGEPEPVTIRTGAAAGGNGELAISTAGPHAWVVTDRLVVTVAGDLTQEEMLRLLGSLEEGR